MDSYEYSDDLEMTQVILRGVLQDQLQGVSVDQEAVLSQVLPVHGVKDEKLNDVVNQVRRVASILQRDAELNRSIDSAFPLCDKSDYWAMVGKVIEDGITWDKIVVLIYIAVKITIKNVNAYLPERVLDILSWTLEFFQRRLLHWICQQGGWVACHFRKPTAQGWVIFLCGIMLGGLVMWKMGRRS